MSLGAADAYSPEEVARRIRLRQVAVFLVDYEGWQRVWSYAQEGKPGYSATKYGGRDAVLGSEVNLLYVYR